jgi:hypothetical protein
MEGIAIEWGSVLYKWQDILKKQKTLTPMGIISLFKMPRSLSLSFFHYLRRHDNI